MNDVSNSEADKNLRVKCVCRGGGGGGEHISQLLASINMLPVNVNCSLFCALFLGL